MEVNIDIYPASVECGRIDSHLFVMEGLSYYSNRFEVLSGGFFFAARCSGEEFVAMLSVQRFLRRMTMFTTNTR